MNFFTLAPDDASFRAVSLLLAEHPVYAEVPLKRLSELFDTVRRLGQAFGAVDENNRLLGVVLWRELNDATAVQSVEQRRLPTRSECMDQGQAVVATAFLTLEQNYVSPLFNAFIAHHAGKIILYERHRPGNAIAAVFKWIDKSGRRMGDDLGSV